MGKPKKYINQRISEFNDNIYPEPNTGCWLWSGRLNKAGYGHGHFVRNKVQLAHRFSYMIHVGPIPSGMGILHHCDTPSCVNPDHLYPGNQQENCNDRERRKRGNRAKGENNGRSKLTCDLVKKIRSEYIPFSNGTIKLAKKYNVSQYAIMSVVSRKNWKHI